MFFVRFGGRVNPRIVQLVEDQGGRRTVIYCLGSRQQEEVESIPNGVTVEKGQGLARESSQRIIFT